MGGEDPSGERPADESAPRGLWPSSPPARAGERADVTSTSASPSPRRERGLGGEDPLTILRRFGERLAAGDAEGAAALFAPDAEYDEPQAYSFRGRDALRTFIADFAAAHTGVRFEVVRTLASPDGATLAAEWRWSYTRTADGTRRAFAGMCFVELRVGLIARWRGFTAQVL